MLADEIQLECREVLERVGGEIGAVPDFEDVVETGELAFDLVEARGVGKEEEHAAGGTVVDGDAEDGVEVEGAAGKEAGDVGHRAGMIADAKLENGRGRRGRHRGRRARGRNVVT